MSLENAQVEVYTEKLARRTAAALFAETSDSRTVPAVALQLVLVQRAMDDLDRLRFPPEGRRQIEWCRTTLKTLGRSCIYEALTYRSRPEKKLTTRWAATPAARVNFINLLPLGLRFSLNAELRGMTGLVNCAGVVFPHDEMNLTQLAAFLSQAALRLSVAQPGAAMAVSEAQDRLAALLAVGALPPLPKGIEAWWAGSKDLGKGSSKSDFGTSRTSVKSREVRGKLLPLFRVPVLVTPSP